MLSFLSCSSSKRLYPANHLSSGAPDSREGAKVHRLNVETGTLTCGSSPDSGPARCPAHHISQPRPTHSAVPPISPTTPPTAPPLHPPHRAGLTLHPRPAQRIPPPRLLHPIAPPTTPRRFALHTCYWLGFRPAPPQAPTKATPPTQAPRVHTRFLLADVPPHPAHDTVTSWQRTLGRRKFVRRRQRSGAEVLLALPAALPGLCSTPASWRREPGTMAVRQLRSLAGSGG